jgi:Spy/CpxP family protein refolding chaperone
MRHILSVATAAVLILPSAASAQRKGNQPPPAREKQALARQVRQAFAGVVRRQLNLSDEQSRKLQDIDTKYQRQRTEIVRDERAAREDLRLALSDSTATPDQGKVDGYINRLIQAQRKRADLLDAEQKELAGFLNPVQRGKYLALREQLQKRVGQLRQDGRAGRGAPPPER